MECEGCSRAEAWQRLVVLVAGKTGQGGGDDQEESTIATVLDQRPEGLPDLLVMAQLLVLLEVDQPDRGCARALLAADQLPVQRVQCAGDVCGTGGQQARLRIAVKEAGQLLHGIE